MKEMGGERSGSQVRGGHLQFNEAPQQVWGLTEMMLGVGATVERALSGSYPEPSSSLSELCAALRMDNMDRTSWQDP